MIRLFKVLFLNSGFFFPKINKLVFFQGEIFSGTPTFMNTFYTQGATQPLISLPELVLAKHYPEFFHGRDSVRYQTRSENTFIFHLHRASLLGKSLALHGVIVFPINSHNLQALSRWRKKHSRQRGESWELRRPIRWSWWNSKAQRCEPPSGSWGREPRVRGHGSPAPVSKRHEKPLRWENSTHLPHSPRLELIPWNRNKPQIARRCPLSQMSILYGKM